MNITSLFKRKINDNKSDQPITPNTSYDNSSTMSVNDPAAPVGLNNNNIQNDSPVELVSVPANWIKISSDGEFICSECGNKSAPETNTENGTVTADLSKVKSDLTQFPTKIVYGICPVCGMEFTFKLKSLDMYLEPSEMMK